MHVIIAGSGDAFGSGGRFQTCIAVADHAAGQPHTLLDCGATSLTALRLQHMDPNMIGTVVISHLHGDHFGEGVRTILERMAGPDRCRARWHW